MEKKQNSLNTYTLSEEALSELHRRYGKPGEVAPGIKAPRKRMPKQASPDPVPLIEVDE